jgi:hypothetical protein
MKLSKEQQHVVTKLIRVGKRMGASKKDIMTAIATGLVEANLTNPSHGDGTSIGWRQEIDTYGSVKERLNIAKSAERFYRELRSAPNGSIGTRAQAVQRSAYPDRYGQRVGEAKSIFRQFNGNIGTVGGIKAPTGKTSKTTNKAAKLAYVQSLNLGAPTEPTTSSTTDTSSTDLIPQLDVQSALKLKRQKSSNTVKQASPQKGNKIPSVKVPKGSGAIPLGTKGAKKFGLTVTSTTGGTHVPGSYHYSGRAVDIAGSPAQMMKFFKWAQRFRPTELFYDPVGYYWKNGQKVKGSIGGHSDHVHMAL